MLCCLNKGQEGCCGDDDDDYSMDPGGYGAPLPVILTLRANTNRNEIRGELDSPPRSRLIDDPPGGGGTRMQDIFRSPPTTPLPPHPVSSDHHHHHHRQTHDRDTGHPVKASTGYPVRASHGGLAGPGDPPLPHPPSAFQSGYSG